MLSLRILISSKLSVYGISFTLLVSWLFCLYTGFDDIAREQRRAKSMADQRISAHNKAIHDMNMNKPPLHDHPATQFAAAHMFESNEKPQGDNLSQFSNTKETGEKVAPYTCDDTSSLNDNGEHKFNHKVVREVLEEEKIVQQHTPHGRIDPFAARPHGSEAENYIAADRSSVDPLKEGMHKRSMDNPRDPELPAELYGPSVTYPRHDGPDVDSGKCERKST